MTNVLATRQHPFRRRSLLIGMLFLIHTHASLRTGGKCHPGQRAFWRDNIGILPLAEPSKCEAE
jgi:hypothetical protein